MPECFYGSKQDSYGSHLRHVVSDAVPRDSNASDIEESESESDNDELVSSASFSNVGDTDTQSSNCVSINTVSR